MPEAIYEFRVVATRPIANNGLGLLTVECENEVARIEASFPLLDAKPNLFIEWKAVVSAFARHGKVAHDARLVAAMRTHGLTHLLTFNGSDFSRYPGIVLLDPNGVVSTNPPIKPP